MGFKNWLVSWSDDKELLSGADAVGWNSFSQKKEKKKKGAHINWTKYCKKTQ